MGARIVATMALGKMVSPVWRKCCKRVCIVAQSNSSACFRIGSGTEPLPVEAVHSDLVPGAAIRIAGGDDREHAICNTRTKRPS